MKIDKILKQWRKATGFNQTEAAFHLGVSQTTYYKWEAEKAQPQLKYLPRIAQACQVELSCIIPKDLLVALSVPSMPQESVEINAVDLLKNLQAEKNRRIANLQKQVEVLEANVAALKAQLGEL